MINRCEESDGNYTSIDLLISATVFSYKAALDPHIQKSLERYYLILLWFSMTAHIPFFVVWYHNFIMSTIVFSMYWITQDRISNAIDVLYNAIPLEHPKTKNFQIPIAHRRSFQFQFSVLSNKVAITYCATMNNTNPFSYIFYDFARPQTTFSKMSHSYLLTKVLLVSKIGLDNFLLATQISLALQEIRKTAWGKV